MKNAEIVTTEVSSTQSNTVKITFPEGFTVTEIAEKLEKNGVCSANGFINEANNSSYLEEYGIIIDNPKERSFLLEGYLFPDTYEFYIGENPSSVIKRFLGNFRTKMADAYFIQAEDMGFSFDEILRIASIIQEEAGIQSEDKKVSSVIHNRLSDSSFKKLQCDCCTFYLNNSVREYVSDDRFDELRELYNTYRCSGLPAGPITNPGIDCIKAALYPADTGYYFFVTDENGVYYYAENWNGHLENCSRAGIE